MQNILYALILVALLTACNPIPGHDGQEPVQEIDTTGQNPPPPAPYKVRARIDFDKNPAAGWTDGFTAQTIETIAGFTPEEDPETDSYGGWTFMNLGGSGFFRVEKADGRWWLVDPLGNIFISKGVTSFSPNQSARSIAKRKELFGGDGGGQTGYHGWVREETAFLKRIGFNSLGAWSIPQTMRSTQYMPYTVIFSPMQRYNSALKASGREAEAYRNAKSWEGYPYDFAMVFDTDFDIMLETVLQEAADFRDDPNLIGYFIDNELPWKNYALEMCLTRWPAGHVNHDQAQAWLDTRKGRSGVAFQDADEADKKAFIAYCYEVYLQKVTAVLKKYDPNHLLLGNRFNQWSHELQNEKMFRTAGRYVDAVSINHYRKWQPDQAVMADWAAWAGKPFLITEFYVKGEDASMENPYLTNTSGAGWVVPTQNDRGLFYENFVIELLRSDACIGWHWFRYMDNDPEDPSADTSNRNANKGIVKWDFGRYDDLVSHMQAINSSTCRLARFFRISAGSGSEAQTLQHKKGG